MAIIERIIIKNYKRFKDFSIYPNEHLNILIGDNETGKSTILEAIDIVCSASTKKVESLGLSNIFNIEAINEFLNGEKKFELLPKIIIELFLKGDFDYNANGKNNSTGSEYDGIKLVIEPDDSFVNEINAILSSSDRLFPFEFYRVKFFTFGGDGYSAYNKLIKSAFIDSSKMRDSYTTKEYIKKVYNIYTEENSVERVLNRSDFNNMKISFCNDKMKSLNDRISSIENCTFSLRNSDGYEFENELMILENGINLEFKGTGKQIKIKTKFALDRIGENIDVVLIEEPENHLSYNNLREMMEDISNKTSGQLFITTHNSYICMRLELRNALILHKESCSQPFKLNDLSDETSKFFLKTPPIGILDYILSDKSILVEGPAEYMLFDKFYVLVTGHKMEEDDVQVFDARGLSFKRYLEIAKLLGNKVVVITDNDKDYNQNIIEKYKDYDGLTNIKICSNTDETQWTFEVNMESCNKKLCAEKFGDNALDYMLKNKTDSAYVLATCENDILVPDYIKEGIEWIKY